MKVDLHTHSVASYDGGISAKQYRHALHSGELDCVAVTDHNRVDFALELHKELGNQIIVGEEIMAAEGEIIGLFLTKRIEPGLAALETIKQIRKQKGLIYIPHPFETVRKGLPVEVLDELAPHIDIIEVVNGRAFFQNRGQKTVLWARLNHKPGAASSDAHGPRGLGGTYTTIAQLPSRGNLVSLLANAKLTTARPAPRALLYPKYHRLRKKVGRKS